MYIANKFYCLKTIKHTSIDKSFIDISYEYQKRFPGKWENIINYVLFNEEISYFRDTTCILNISLVDFAIINDLFEILKQYLNGGIIYKIIYKKEFVIIHFNNNFHIEFFKNKSSILFINLYKFLLKNYFGIFDIYFGGILSYKDTKKHISIILIYDKKIYLFTDNIQYRIEEDNNINFIELYDYKTKYKSEISNYRLKYNSMESSYINEIDLIIKKSSNS